MQLIMVIFMLGQESKVDDKVRTYVYCIVQARDLSLLQIVYGILKSARIVLIS